MNARRRAGALGLALPLLLAGGWASGCGDSQAERPVRLEITAPTDAAVVHDESVEVRGLVHPRGARVLVLGRRVRVARGEFRATVPLEAGSNLIDVGASARGAAPAWNALRVTREVLVTLPDLIGATRADAIDAARGSGSSRGGRRGRRPRWTNCSAVTGSSARAIPPRAATCRGGPASSLPFPGAAEPGLAIGRGGNEPHAGTALLAVDAEGDPACDRPSARP